MADRESIEYVECWFRVRRKFHSGLRRHDADDGLFAMRRFGLTNDE